MNNNYISIGELNKYLKLINNQNNKSIASFAPSIQIPT